MASAKGSGPSSRAAHVWPLVDYFLVIGGGGDGETPQPLQPLRRTSRSDSTVIQPIRDLVVVESPNLKGEPHLPTPMQLNLPSTHMNMMI
jgi:hypothetical protein